MAPNGQNCPDVSLRIYSLTHSLSQSVIILQYLNDTLGEYIQMVMESSDNFEVDPSVTGSSSSSSADLQRRRARLTESCRLVWYKIVNSQSQLPL